MSITAIVSGIVILAKALPAARDILNMVQAQILKWELESITNQYTEKQKLIDTLISSISRAETKEERRALTKIMARYTSGNF
jgi:hypothetical protein